MQKKAISIVVLVALLLIGPVIAAPEAKNRQAQKTTFTNRIILAAGGSTQGEQMITGTGILHVKDSISIGYVEAYPNSPISGSVWTSLSGSVNLNTMLGSFNGKWTIKNERGTFEGSLVGFVTVPTVYGKFVGHGTGDFEGQKIQGSFEGTVNNYIVNLILQGTLTSK